MVIAYSLLALVLLASGVIAVAFSQRPPKAGLEAIAYYLRTVALMVERSFLTVEHRESGRFVQFLRNGSDATHGCDLIFDLPRTAANTQVFDAVASRLRHTEWEVQEVLEPLGAGEVLVLKVRIRGAYEQVVTQALELVKHVLPALGISESDRFAFRLIGQKDNDAVRRASAENLKAMASSRIPIVNWLGRREVRKLEDQAKH